MNAKLCFPIAFVLTLAGCSSSKPPESQTAQPQHRFQAKETDVTVNGKKAVELSRPQSADTTKPQILSADSNPFWDFGYPRNASGELLNDLRAAGFFE